MASIYYQNCRGLRTKTNDFYRNLCMSNYDIISLTETWLLGDISDTELFNDNYLVFRRDRDYAMTQQTRGGGVLIAVHRNFACTPNFSWNSSAEDIWITLTLRNARSKKTIKLHICTIYLCNQNMGNSFSVQLANFLTKLQYATENFKHDEFLVLGDFNMSSIFWIPSDIGLQPLNVIGLPANNLVDTIYDCNLKQYNNHTNHSGGILDLVLCSNTVSVSICPDPLVPEDAYHKSLIIKPTFIELDSLEIPRRKIFMYRHADYELICNHLSTTDWSKLSNTKSMEEAVSIFYELILKLRDTFVPTRITPSHRYPPWYKPYLVKIIKEKFKFLKKYKTYGNISDDYSFRLLRDRVKKAENKCYKEYIMSVEDSISKNPKLFWSYIKSKRGSSCYPSTMTYLSRTSDSCGGTTQLFSAYFSSTFLPATDTFSPSSHSVKILDTPCDLSNIEVSKDRVSKLLSALDLNKSAGPDTLPALFLAKCARELSHPVTILFRRSLSDGVMPKLWKSALITPVHKKGAKNEVTNYRPISKLCLLAKIFERLVFDQMYESFKNIIIPQQHGFVRARSTSSNLVTFLDYITVNMDRGNQIDTVYTDYSKAFDRLDHNILLRKLSALGIHGDLYRWFVSYVTNRTQAVAMNGCTSDWVSITSGVPQGSLLGPLLFVLFVNDIGSCFLNSHFLLYADDMKIFREVNKVSDVLCLQEDLNRLDAYCNLNKLDLNVTKCSVISFTRKRHNFLSRYTLKGACLERVNVVKDLGVLLDSKLLFDHHVNHIVDKAHRTLGFILRASSPFKNMKSLKVIYCAYVRSHLEYASQVWNPCYYMYNNIIERIQKRFLRYLGFKFKLQYLDYDQQCTRLHLLPLHLRRQIADISFLLKIAQNGLDCSDLLSNLYLNTPTRRLRSHNLLHTPFCHTNYRKNSYFPRAIHIFNKLNLSNPNIDLFCSKPHYVTRLLSKEPKILLQFYK